MFLQQRIILKGSDERIDYFTDLFKSAKDSSGMNGADVLLDSVQLWKENGSAPDSTFSKSSSSSSRPFYLHVLTSTSMLTLLEKELNRLKMDKVIKLTCDQRAISRREILLEALIIILENRLTNKLEKEVDRPRTPLPKKVTIQSEKENLENVTSPVPVMTLKERQEHANRIGLYLLHQPPEIRPLPGYENQDVNRISLGIDCDEILPQIILGNGSTLKKREYLKQIGITHILNAAEFRGVNIDENYFRDQSIVYKGLKIEDTPQTQICRYFEDVARFIHEAITESDGNKIYVNCVFGKSRSTTCIAAYLMKYRGLNAFEALSSIRKIRPVQINPGFLNQLADFDHALQWKRSNRNRIEAF